MQPKLSKYSTVEFGFYPESAKRPEVFSLSSGNIAMQVCILGFHQVWYQGGVKATVSGVVEDLKFKISDGSDQFLS